MLFKKHTVSCFSRALNIPSVIFSGSLHNFPDPQGHLKALVTNLIVGQVEYCNGLVDPKGISQGLEAWKNQPTNRVFQMPNFCRGFQLHKVTNLFVSLQFLHGVQLWKKKISASLGNRIGWPSPTPNAQELYDADTCWHNFPTCVTTRAMPLNLHHRFGCRPGRVL